MRQIPVTSVSDPDSLNPDLDPDPAFLVNPDSDPGFSRPKVAKKFS
jgi:hypothetical protein